MATRGQKAVAKANAAAKKAADDTDPGTISRWFSTFASAIAHAAGRPPTFVLACLLIVAWGITGPIFHYSDTWQLVINTGTTIVTFLMVFLIQNTQNRDGLALQAKLDELIRTHYEARNEYVGIEKKPEEQLLRMRDECESEAASEDRSVGHNKSRRK